MGLRMKNFDIMVDHWKIWFLGGIMKIQYIGGITKKGTLSVWRFRRRLGKKVVLMFLTVGVVIPQCTLLIRHYDINRPRSRRGHKYKYKNCLSMMIFICTKQLLSNIWSSIHEKLKQHWDWLEKKALLIKKSV